MRILVMYNLFEEALKPLREKFEVDIITHKPSNEELREYLKKYDGIISLLSYKFTEDMFTDDVKVKIISNYAVGYDNIPIDECKEKGIVVCNTPDVLTRATAELSFALLISVARRFHEGEELVRSGVWDGWKPDLLLGYELLGMKIGIIGAGRIGREMMKLCKAFGMDVYYYSRNRKKEADEFGKYTQLDEMLEIVDAVSLHVPLTDETYHLLDRNRLLKMKKGSILINTSRGDVIDETALIELLKNGHFHGAGLDVFHNEPDVNEELRKLNNVILLPHIGSATYKTRYKMAEIAVNAVINFFEGKEIPNRVV